VFVVLRDLISRLAFFFIPLKTGTMALLMLPLDIFSDVLAVTVASNNVEDILPIRQVNRMCMHERRATVSVEL